MNDIEQHILEMSKAHNDIYKAAYQAGYEAGLTKKQEECIEIKMQLQSALKDGSNGVFVGLDWENTAKAIIDYINKKGGEI